MNLTVFKASRTIQAVPVEDLTIQAVEECPEHKTLNEAHRLYDAQGAEIATALWTSLPGGTLDAILRYLLERRASLLRVRFDA
jgi:hypothetical protein